MTGTITAWIPTTEEKSNKLSSDWFKGTEVRMDAINGGEAIFNDDFKTNKFIDEGKSSIESIRTMKIWIGK